MSRPQVLLGGLLLVMAVFVARLFYLQVIQHDYYEKQARTIQVQPLVIVPTRGEVYMRDGDDVVPVVLNEKVYTVFADPYEVKDIAKTTSLLKGIIGGNLEGNTEALLRDDTKQVRYRVLARNITRVQADLINKEQLPGIGMQQTSRRVYPEGTLAAQALGFVDNDGKGRYGIEGALNDRLTGRAGLLQTVTDVRQIPLTIGKDDIDRPAVNGDNVVLTIDRTVQLKTEEILKAGLEKVQATTGSILIMNPNDGSVLAMASYPSYDPAAYSKVDDYALFQNRIISSPFENGSVVKPLVIAGGLDSGVITTSSTYNDATGCTKVEDRTICNVPEAPRLAPATMQDILTYSLNTGSVYIARQMGGGQLNLAARNKLYYYFHDQFRFGQLTGIEQEGESGGIIIAPGEQEGNNVRYSNMVFGQGMEQTMIQTSAAFSSVINGGTYYQPRLVAGIRGDDGKLTPKAPVVLNEHVVSEAAANATREMTQQGRKRGPFGRLDPEGFIVGGKTGTAQIIDPETGKYIFEKTIGTYVGFGGETRPEYVIMIRVDDSKLPGNHGSAAAAPVFNDMNSWMLDYIRLQPAG